MKNNRNPPGGSHIHTGPCDPKWPLQRWKVNMVNMWLTCHDKPFSNNFTTQPDSPQKTRTTKAILWKWLWVHPTNSHMYWHLQNITILPKIPLQTQLVTKPASQRRHHGRPTAVPTTTLQKLSNKTKEPYTAIAQKQQLSTLGFQQPFPGYLTTRYQSHKR